MMFALILLTGCGGSGSQDNTKKDQPAPKNKIGMIIHLNATENKVAELYAEAMKNAGIDFNKNVIKYYDNLKLMQMGLDSNDVNIISVYHCVAGYLMAMNDKYALDEEFISIGLSDSFCFAVQGRHRA